MRSAWRALVVAAGLVATPALAAVPDDCAPAEDLAFICGTGAVEEIVAVPGTRWLIGSALNIGVPARLQLIDTHTRQARPIPLDIAVRARTAICPGLPDPARWSMDGLSLAPLGGRRFRLFAANHGDRQAIEVFDVLWLPAGPRLRWVDCLPMPAGTLANAIAAVDAGELFVTSFHRAGDPQAWARMARREPTGSVWRWRTGRGFSRVPLGAVSGANGIALSADHRRLYVSAWSERALIEVDRTTGRRRRISLDFLPDNLHVAADGTLLIGGQRTSVAAIGKCGATCPQPWVVVRLDPRTGLRMTLAQGAGSARVDYACGALAIGDLLFITVRGADRIAYRTLPIARYPATLAPARSAR